MQSLVRFTLLLALALVPSGCARTSPDSVRTDSPDEPVRANEDNPGLEPLTGPVVDTVGSKESMTPTDGAAPVKPGTEDTGNPGGSTVQEPGDPKPPR